MKFVGFEELGNSGKPKLKDFLEKSEYKDIDKIINYLKNERISKVVCVSTGLPKDIFTGKPLETEEFCLSDGVFAWSNILAYYVKNYYLRLPKDFEQHILNFYKGT